MYVTAQLLRPRLSRIPTNSPFFFSPNTNMVEKLFRQYIAVVYSSTQHNIHLFKQY